MKNVEIYKKRMERTMIRSEKLFFLDHIDLRAYDIIVDFGGANGAMIHAIQNELIKEQLRLPYQKYVIVDNSSQMQTDYTLHSTYRYQSLADFERSFNAHKIFNGEDLCNGPLDEKVILFICSSVLHECDVNTVNEITEFCDRYVQTLVMRDMCYSKRADMTQEEYQLINTRLKELGLLERFNDLREHHPANNEVDAVRELIHFILKFEYVENWETEVLEDYFSNHIEHLKQNLLKKSWGEMYSRYYALPYKDMQARKIFGLRHGLPPTHAQIILEKI